MTIVTLGIDLGKNLNSIVGLDVEGQVVLRRRVRRTTLAELADKLAPCTVAMEACCGAHHIGRLFAAKGHDVRLMSPEYVRPYVRAQKNDDNDAAGIAEAATRPTMRFVELKSQDRLDLQTLHRARSRLIAARKTLLNQLRAILLERGYVFRQGRKVLEREIDPFLAEPPSDLSTRILTLVEDMRAEWRSLDKRIDVLNDDLTEHARADEAASRLTSIPGIGVLGATALVAAVGDGEAFRRARDMPAWLGLVPKQMTTGGKPRLLSITKRGNTYLRMLLIHGARAALHRKPEQAEAIAKAGSFPVLGDIIDMTADDLASAARGCDGIVFSAGAAGSGLDRTTAIDGDGPIKTVEAARSVDISRLYLVSAFPEAGRQRERNDRFEHYMAEKKRADVALASSDLDWVIVRPGTLVHEDGDGRLALGAAVPYGPIARGNVARVLAALIQKPAIRREIVELTDGQTPVNEAVDRLVRS